MAELITANVDRASYLMIDESPVYRSVTLYIARHKP